MAAAARAIAQRTADDEQRRRMRAADEARNHEDRRAIWMGFDGRDPDGEDRRGSGVVARLRDGLSLPARSGPCPVGRAGCPDPGPAAGRLIDVDA